MQDFLYDLMEPKDELCHYGISGMHWYERRFQNKDGSLTLEGRLRYGSGKGKSSTAIATTTTTDTHARTKGQTLKDTTDLSMVAIAAAKGNPFAMKALADTAIANVTAARYAKERNRAPIDEKSGFHVKTKELNEAQDLKRVNPLYKTFNSDKHNNCALCTVTADLRKRGLDVTVKPAAYGYTADDMKRWYPKIQSKQINKVTNPSSINYAEKARQRKAATEEFVNDVLSHGDGARGNIGVQWHSTRGGHSMMWEVHDGKVRIIDGQSAKIYNDPHKILKRVDSIHYSRLDDLTPDWNAIKECCE